MAEMIPESIAAMEQATSGEKRVFRVMKHGLLPDKDYIVWHEPATMKRYPDFVVWAQYLGLVVIEVKDWKLAQVSNVAPNKWIISRKGVEESCESPTQQARSCFRLLKDLLQRSSELRHKEGRHKGKLKFPIGYCVVFTKITRQEAEHSGMLPALGSTAALFSDDLAGNYSQPNSRHALGSKLKQAFPVSFVFELQHRELARIRYLLFPEVRIHHSRGELRSSAEHAEIQVLDLQQEQTAKNIAEGHRVLKGVAGSGKTLVLSCRASFLKETHPGWRILIVCYNIALCQHIKQLLAASEAGMDHASIDVYHYHGLVKELTQANLKQLATETSEQWGARVGLTLTQHIITGKLLKYNAVLIDEGQDFAVEWLQSLTALLDKQSNSLLLCLDPAQNIFGRKVTYKSVGINVRGKRPTLLAKSYRNTAEILQLARQFSGVQNTPEDPDHEWSIDSVLFPMDSDRHGQGPRIICLQSTSDQILFLLKEISHLIEKGLCNWSDIGVLYASNFDSFIQRFSNAFHQQFSHDKLYEVSTRESKLGLDLSSASVKLIPIASAKGMEFRVVFLVGLDRLPRPRFDEASERKLVYVGLTRAQDMLYVLGSTRSGLFQELVKIAETANSLTPSKRLI